EDPAWTYRTSCGVGLLGGVGKTGDLHVHADSIIHTGSAGGIFRSAAIKSARRRAVCRRRIWRENASSAGTFGIGVDSQGAPTGAVGVDAGRSVFDGPLSGRSGE